ncbi:hypothetical protein D9757_007622 [Collybiopsis confluens]|uniref:Uncharacterized protein n=1 Tax=Collybiopsis confluens TaxID=2823264 RepID=A0A8H5M392_9AGAR|nr:hypothetical protein D9757_007622 [Collybiopsis confluens]
MLSEIPVIFSSYPRASQCDLAANFMDNAEPADSNSPQWVQEFITHLARCREDRFNVIVLSYSNTVAKTKISLRLPVNALFAMTATLLSRTWAKREDLDALVLMTISLSEPKWTEVKILDIFRKFRYLGCFWHISELVVVHADINKCLSNHMGIPVQKSEGQLCWYRFTPDSGAAELTYMYEHDTKIQFVRDLFHLNPRGSEPIPKLSQTLLEGITIFRDFLPPGVIVTSSQLMSAPNVQADDADATEVDPEVNANVDDADAGDKNEKA